MSRQDGYYGASMPSSSGKHPGWPARLGPVQVAAGTLELRVPRLSDARAWSALRMRDRAHLAPWEPTVPGSWAERNSTLAWFNQWFALRGMAKRGMSLPFMITVDGELAGQITVGNVVRGALCSAWVGYWVASDRLRQGVASAAVALVVDHCFAETGLHRLDATVRPENTASLGVLTRLGFRQEGLLCRYLDVAGDWRDHYCLAITAEETGQGLIELLASRGRVRR